MRRLPILLALVVLAGCASPTNDDDDATTTPAGATATPAATRSDPFATPTAAQATPTGPAATPAATPAPPALKPCPTELPKNGTSGRLVHIYVGSESGRTSCVRVEIDGVPVVARDIESSAAGLPARPFRYSDTRLDATKMTVWVEESAGGKAKGETFDLPPEVYLIVTVTANDIRLEVSDREPRFA